MLLNLKIRFLAENMKIMDHLILYIHPDYFNRFNEEILDDLEENNDYSYVGEPNYEKHYFVDESDDYDQHLDEDFKVQFFNIKNPLIVDLFNYPDSNNFNTIYEYYVSKTPLKEWNTEYKPDLIMNNRKSTDILRNETKLSNIKIRSILNRLILFSNLNNNNVKTLLDNNDLEILSNFNINQINYFLSNEVYNQLFIKMKELNIYKIFVDLPYLFTYPVELLNILNQEPEIRIKL